MNRWNSTIKVSTKPIRRRSKSPLKRAKARAWKAFSDYIKLRDALKTTGDRMFCRCVTCNAVKAVGVESGIQAGHWLGGRSGKNLFDERGCSGQCVHCNCYLNGNKPAYDEYMKRTYGQAVMDELSRQVNELHTWTLQDLESIEKHYKSELERLTNGV